ncbi:ATP-binding protein [Paenibacillus sp. TRM 82003]|uniref:ATP-binding protein n=1 Tax=Kineococcus sp. TRM81007 TaxID=2925831 RepID=UPI001F57DDCA|nr:ATP-binding protein [Kineococcus sp. TRM81007]MCI2239521.1 ATP-binding protein [Kineococcus sp. TRM81007]MCI3926198.1 ATP-binding protein [Paenibacillus sp. TRM 82003]
MDDDGALSLPAEAGSAARARHHVRRTLDGRVSDDVVADAEVCASELVTNAVLHAGGPLLLTVHRTGEVVRLALADPSPVLPQWVPRSLTATTGRGLPLLTALSVARGADAHDDGGGGKTVWCELSTTPARAGAGEGDDAGEGSAPAAEWASVLADLGGEPPAPVARGEGPPVRLLRYPLRRGVRLREHREAVLRELRLLGLAHAFSDPGTADLADEVTGLLDAEYGGHLNAAETRKVAALAAGLECVDLEYARRPGHSELLQRWRSRMAEVDRLGRAAELLTTGEPPDVAELAAWIVEEFERQLDGGEPHPWNGPLD